MFLTFVCGWLCAIYWSQVLSGEWRCNWNSADRRCSNCIWVINNSIAYKSAAYIRDLTVGDATHSFTRDLIIYPCLSNFNKVNKPPLRLRYGWVITSHSCMWMLLCIHALNPKLDLLIPVSKIELVAYLIKEVNQSLANLQLKFDGGLFTFGLNY